MDDVNVTPAAASALASPAASELDGLTGEQQLELARLQADNAATRLELAKMEEGTRAEEAAQRELRQKQAVKGAFEQAGIRFYEPGLVETLIRSQHDLQFSEDGQTATALVKGKRVPLKDAIREIAVAHDTLVADRRTMPRTEPEKPKARDQMSQREKIEYLKTHSADEYAALPARAVQMVEIRTMADYSRLPVATRTALLAKHGLQWLERLPRK
jgi:hypothetical protein